MLKNNAYVYGNNNISIPAHCNYGKDMLEKMKTYGNKIALIDADLGQSMTYSELAQQTVDIALALIHMGVKNGDVVSICSEKRMEVMVATFGIMCAGATYSPLDITCGEATFHHRLSISRPRIVFCSPHAYFTHHSFMRAGGVQKFVVFGEQEQEGIGVISMSQLIANKAPVEQFLPAPVDGWKDNLLVIFSSGTTGLPKGVPVTHYNFLVSSNFKFDNETLGLTLLITREWHHTYGLLHTLISMYIGSTVVFSASNKLEDLLKYVQEYKVQALQLCPTAINELVKSEILDEYDVTSLTLIITTGNTCDAKLLNSLKNRLPSFVKVYQVYGMTEANQVCSEMNALHGCRAGSVGVLSPGVVAKVVDLNTRKPLGPNQRGEICIQSLTLMKGYLGGVEYDYLDEDNFYKTGDVGYYDDDEYFYIVDRVKDLIKYYDMSLAPAEFEAILLQHPAVREAGVVGAPHPDCGEVATAFVVLQPGMEVSAEELVAMVDQQVSHQAKLVGGVRFVEKLPRGAVDKLDRKALKLML